MGTEALEKIFLYWLCHLPDAGALQIRRIGEAAGSFQQAYYIEGTQLWKERQDRSEACEEKDNPECA